MIFRYKLVVADILVEWIRPIRTEASRLLSDPGYLEDVLEAGASKAVEIAAPTMELVRQRIGYDRIAKELKREGIHGLQ